MGKSKIIELPTVIGAGGRILRLKDLQAMLGVGRSTIYDWLNQKSPRYNKAFPQPIRLSISGRGAIGWIEMDVFRWIEYCKVSQG